MCARAPPRVCERALLVGGRHFWFPPAEQRAEQRLREQATGGHCPTKHGAMALFALVVEKAAGQTGNTGHFDVFHAHKLTQI